MKKRGLTSVIVVIAFMVGVGVGRIFIPDGDPETAETKLVRVEVLTSFDVTLEERAEYEESCDTTGRFEDTGNGIPVIVYVDGDLVASARTIGGKYVSTSISNSASLDSRILLTIECETAAIVRVPFGNAFYSIEIGSEKPQIYSSREVFDKSLRFSLRE